MASRYFFLLVSALVITIGIAADLPTVYEYYTADGITSGLSVEEPYFTLNGKNITIYSGAIHYFRVPPQLWRDRLRKLRATGLNTVETYIAWNMHEPENGTYEWGQSGTDLELFGDIEGFIKIAQEEDLLVIVRPGPYICAEWEWGGFPSWLLRADGIHVRTSDPTYMYYVERYFNKLLPRLAELQFTKGGPIIMVQVENEYAYADQDKVYLQQLVDIMGHYGIVELLVTSDGAGSGTGGTLPGILFQTVNFGNDAAANFGRLEEMQPNKPLMVMEHYPGWLDHWTEIHHTTDVTNFRNNYEEVLAYPGSANFYMFHGGTNWGFLNGANNGPGDNSNFQPTTTSYDYDAPLTEAGDYTEKYDIIRELLQQYNPIQTLTPDPPELIPREAYPSIAIVGQLSVNDLFERSPDGIESETVPMEKLPINQGSGQSYGYIAYRQKSINIPANSVLTITGHVWDTVGVLINGVLVSNRLTSSDDLNGFGYWREENSNITLTSEDLDGATLDLIFENWGRVNFGNLYTQFKGLTPANQVYLNEDELTSWTIYPFEFKKKWTMGLSDWGSVEGGELINGPGLYRAVLTLDAEPTDTFIDMQEWDKGIVIVNGFVLGRYATYLGPQQTLYLPGPFLQQGDNEIIVVEHFTPAAEIKFSQDSIFYTP